MRDDVYTGMLVSRDSLKHYGKGHDDNPPGRGSGRYPYGSGERPHQHKENDYQFANQPILSRIKDALTPVTKKAVKNKYNEFIKNNTREKAYQRKRFLNAGLDTSNSEYDTLKAGSVLGRFSTNPNESDDKRKYMFIVSVDQKAYRDAALNNSLGFHDDKPSVYRYESRAKKDLKIAKAEEVQKYIFDNYWRIGVKKYYDLLRDIDHNNHWRTTSDLVWKSDRIYDFKIGSYVHRGESIVADFFNDKIFSNPKGMDDLVNHFKSKGYDAIVDPEDEMLNFSYPLIVLNPADSIETVKVHKVKR